MMQSKGPIMRMFFSKCPFLIEFLPLGQTINGDQYCNSLESLHASIKAKWPGKLSSGVILLHGNARPHTGTRTLSKLE
ncbi:hypothetical protein CEXT_390581 [Caerostris extrusa]|uniref:Transposase n=1 Tax=Caerostris extrusa TaxID=172846 RepID=A0AAV4UWX8_CAEEX|nr:hypothetical protein CEXT_390581 [Caerostris extrusa]